MAVVNQTGMHEGQDTQGKRKLGKTLPFWAILIDKLVQPYRLVSPESRQLSHLLSIAMTSPSSL